MARSARPRQVCSLLSRPRRRLACASCFFRSTVTAKNCMTENSIPDRTQVGIVGGGPAGLMLGQLLHLQGIDSVILERRPAEHVIERVRAGVLEQTTVDLLTQAGVGERLHREGMRHDGIYLAFGGSRHHIDFSALTGGRAITIYGQNEVVRDLIDARRATGAPLLFETPDVSVQDLETSRPRIKFSEGGRRRELTCDFIAGCDGFH